jgi:hypothetical protein
LCGLIGWGYVFNVLSELVLLLLSMNHMHRHMTLIRLPVFSLCLP